VFCIDFQRRLKLVGGNKTARKRQEGDKGREGKRREDRNLHSSRESMAHHGEKLRRVHALHLINANTRTSTNTTKNTKDNVRTTHYKHPVKRVTSLSPTFKTKV